MVIRDRKELPPYALMPYKFDIEKIRKELIHMPNKVRDHISNTCDIPAHLNTDTVDGAYSSHAFDTYHMIPLTEYDEKNTEEFDDYKTVKNPMKDERRYTKVLDWVKDTYLEEVLNTFKGQVTRTHMRRMNPGGYIKYHYDYNTKYSIRFHIPLTTNEGALFRFKLNPKDEEQVLHMPADGSCYFFNAGYLHQAENNGTTDRDHLVLAVHGQDDIQHL